MKIANKTSDAASRDTRKAPQPGTSADDDFSVRMGYVGKSVELLWPKNIKSILSSGDSVCPAGATERKELNIDRRDADIESILGSGGFVCLAGATEQEELNADSRMQTAKASSLEGLIITAADR